MTFARNERACIQMPEPRRKEMLVITLLLRKGTVFDQFVFTSYVISPAIVMKRFDLNKNCVTDQKEFKDNTAHTPFRVRIFCPIIPFS